MYNSAITSLSTKGQVVIPEDIRNLIGLKAGAKMMVFTDGSNVMLKPIATPNIAEFDKMARATRAFAKKTGIKKSDGDLALKKARRRARSA